MLQFKKNTILIPAMLAIVGIFFSCTNKLEDIKKIVTHPNTPDQTSSYLHVVYTDSGMAQIEIYATISETYTQPKKVTKFKDGLKVNFYNDQGEIASVLTSKYGEIDQKSGNITVRDSVKLTNIKDQRTLESEVLHWDKGGDSIYTNKVVVITSKNMILSGVGAWTSPTFDTAEFYDPTAKIFLNNKE